METLLSIINKEIEVLELSQKIQAKAANELGKSQRHYILKEQLKAIKKELGDADDTGFAFSAGARGLLAPKFEIRGSVNHINVDGSDTYLQIAGDYYFTSQFSAGVSLDVAGDTDSFSIGGRWYFR